MRLLHFYDFSSTNFLSIIVFRILIFKLDKKVSYLFFSLTWADCHLRITTTCQQRPTFRAFTAFYRFLPLNNDKGGRCEIYYFINDFTYITDPGQWFAGIGVTLSLYMMDLRWSKTSIVCGSFGARTLTKRCLLST